MVSAEIQTANALYIRFANFRTNYEVNVTSIVKSMKLNWLTTTIVFHTETRTKSLTISLSTEFIIDFCVYAQSFFFFTTPISLIDVDFAIFRDKMRGTGGTRVYSPVISSRRDGRIVGTENGQALLRLLRNSVT